MRNKQALTGLYPLCYRNVTVIITCRDRLYSIQSQKGGKSSRLSWKWNCTFMPPRTKKPTSNYKADKLAPSLSLTVMIVFSLLFPLQKEKVNMVNQTSTLAAAESMASVLFCWYHNSAYRPPCDRRKSCGPCSTTFPSSKTIIWK